MLGRVRDLAKRITRDVRARVKNHRPFQLAAQIAFFFLLATQPLLIVVTAVLAYLPLAAYEPRIIELVTEFIPGSAGERFSSMILDVLDRRNPSLISIAAIALLWTASSGTKAVIDATTRIRGIEADPRPWWRLRLRATAITIGLIVLAIVGGALAGGAMKVVHWLLGFQKHEIVAEARWAEIALGYLLIVSGIQLVYHFGPPHPRGPDLPGAVIAVIASVAASYGLSFYVRHVRDLNAIYGSLGAIVLLMLWFYVVGCALVLGAEVNAALAERRGIKRRERLAPQPA